MRSASSSPSVICSVCAGGRRFEIRSSGLQWPAPRQFVEANRDRLPQVHGDIFLFGRDVQQPVTMAEVFIRKSDFLRAKQESNPLGLKLLSNHAARRLVEPAHRLLQHAMAHRGRPHDQSAVGHRLGHGLEFFRLLQQDQRRLPLSEPRESPPHKDSPGAAGAPRNYSWHEPRRQCSADCAGAPAPPRDRLVLMGQASAQFYDSRLTRNVGRISSDSVFLITRAIRRPD